MQLGGNVKAHKGLKKFKQESRYPHNRSEGTALRRSNGGTKVLIRERDEADEDTKPASGA